MATLNIEGRRVQVDDSFLKLSPEDQEKTVSEIAASFKIEPSAKPETPLGVEDVVRSTASGVPIIGGLLNKANAATNAALAPVIEPFLDKGPDTLDQPTFGERYQKSLDLQNKRDERVAEEHPITDTVAKVAGGVGSMIPAIAAAPALLGARGTLPQMVKAGAASGAAIGGADAVTRGTDIAEGAGINAAFGAGAPLVARVVGKGVNALRTQPTAVPDTVPVAGVDIPVPNRDPAAASEIEIARKGARGDPAMRIVQDADELAAARLAQANENIGNDLNPGGARATPQTAAETVAAEMSAAEQARFQTAQNAAQRVAQSTDELRAGLAVPEPVPGAPTVQPRVVAPTPFDAGEQLSAGVQRSAQAARARRTAAYGELAETEGEFAPQALVRSREAIVGRLNEGPINDRVVVKESTTPRAREALDVIEQRLNRQNIGNAAETGDLVRDPRTGVPVPRPITASTMEEIRKELVDLQRAASSAARAPGGTQSDARAVRRIISAFDDHVETVAATPGAFSGDAAQFAARQAAARRSHAEYRRLYGSQGGGDEVGNAIEKIIGKYPGQALSPDEIATLSYGSAGAPGGGKSVRIAQRMREIFGPESAEWAAYKQGLFSHVVDRPGAGPAEIADRITEFLTGTKGRGLAAVVLSPAERQSFGDLAERLRGVAPREGAADGVEKIMARITGRDGQIPASQSEIVGMLVGERASADKGIAIKLAQRLKRDMTPEGFNSVRQGLWAKVTEAPDGHNPFTPLQISKRIEDYMKGGVAQVLYTPAERAEMLKLAKAWSDRVPVPGTTNPSGTAPMLAKISAKLAQPVMTLGGLASGGIPGAVAGYALEKGIGRVQNARAAKKVSRLINGTPPPMTIDPRFAAGAALLTRGGTPALSNRRS